MDGATAKRHVGRRDGETAATVMEGATAMEGTTAMEGVTAMDGAAVTAMATVAMDNHNGNGRCDGDLTARDGMTAPQL